MATETEKTAEEFRRDKPQLAGNRQYYRFNVLSGLQGVGLEEAKKYDQIASATREYIQSEEVRSRILEFASQADIENEASKLFY